MSIFPRSNGGGGGGGSGGETFIKPEGDTIVNLTQQNGAFTFDLPEDVIGFQARWQGTQYGYSYLILHTFNLDEGVASPSFPAIITDGIVNFQLRLALNGRTVTAYSGSIIRFEIMAWIK